jgi:hypothetical protein
MDAAFEANNFGRNMDAAFEANNFGNGPKQGQRMIARSVC